MFSWKNEIETVDEKGWTRSEYCIPYRVSEFLVLSYDFGPPSTSSECQRAIHRGNRKTERGEPFRTGKGVGGPNSYDRTETLVLHILYSI